MGGRPAARPQARPQARSATRPTARPTARPAARPSAGLRDGKPAPFGSLKLEQGGSAARAHKPQLKMANKDRASGERIASGAGRPPRDGGRVRPAPSPDSPARRAGIIAAIVAAVALVCVVALLVLSHLPVFVIGGIDAQASEHVSADTLAKLAAVDEGTTLLNVDVGKISDNVRKNPWVKSVNVTREFPSTLGVSVEERTVGAIAVIGGGTSVWALGDDGAWIEPVSLGADQNSDVTSAALAKAEELGCLLIANLPATVDPAQGSAATDEVILDVLQYQSELPDSITSQAQVYYAASAGSISLVLKSGLEISLGAPNDVTAKAQALTAIIDQYGEQLTYVNVRVPSKPSYRKVADGTTLGGAAKVVADNSAATAAAATTGDASGEGSGDGEDSGDDSDSSGSSGSSSDSSDSSSSYYDEEG